MKKIFALLLALLLIFTFVGCAEEVKQPQYALYTNSGVIEIYEVSVDTTFGSDSVKYIKVDIGFINNTDAKLLFSIENFLGYYDSETIMPYIDNELYDSYPPTELDSDKTDSGTIYFQIPINVDNLRIECITETGIALFIFNV
jgi:hypothetical protein